MSKDIATLVPPLDTKIMFTAATAFVRKFAVSKKIIRLTSAHRGRMITLDLGWIIIDQRWYSNLQSQT